MKLKFSPEEGSIIVCLSSYETKSASLSLRSVLEKEEEHGKIVPNFEEFIFRKKFSPNSKTHLLFGFKHLNIGINLIEKILDDDSISSKKYLDTEEKVLIDAKDWYYKNHTLQ